MQSDNELRQFQEATHSIRHSIGQAIVGKTMLAKTLAKSLDCTFRRIQFTPDLLPADIAGITLYNQKLSEFEFRAGPLLTQDDMKQLAQPVLSHRIIATSQSRMRGDVIDQIISDVLNTVAVPVER